MFPINTLIKSISGTIDEACLTKGYASIVEITTEKAEPQLRIVIISEHERSEYTIAIPSELINEIPKKTNALDAFLRTQSKFFESRITPVVEDIRASTAPAIPGFR
jgi:hypothetical protein